MRHLIADNATQFSIDLLVILAVALDQMSRKGVR